MVEMEGIRTSRDEIAHHDSMLDIDIAFETGRVIEVAGWVDQAAASWLAGLDRSAQVHRQRPGSREDTVVVAASNAWPFHEGHHAHVCQPGRWFRPIDRLAFCAEGEIEEGVPRIVGRRDDVPWTLQHAREPSSSTDRTERKIATLIERSHADAWTSTTTADLSVSP